MTMSNGSLIKGRDWVEASAEMSPLPHYITYSAEPQSDSVLAYWRAFCRHKLTMAALAATGLAIGIGITLMQPPTYRATTSLEIQPQRDDDLGRRFFNSSPDQNAAPDAATDIQTQIKILQSRSVIERALEKSGMGSTSDLVKIFGGTKSLFSFLPKPPAASVRDMMLDKIKKNLHVTADSQTRIVEVSFEAPDPKTAATFTNALTAEYIDQNLQARWLTSQKTSEWLLGEIENFRGKLKRSEDALQSYARANGLVYTGDNQSISEAKLRQLQAELSKAESDRVDKESRYEVARETSGDTVPEVLNDNNLRSMEATLTDLRRQEADLSVTFKPDYVKAKRIRAEIDTLESAIAAKRRAIVAGLDNEMKESRQREQLLSAAYSQQTRQVVNDSTKAIQYDVLKHDVDTNRQIYQSMLQRVKESTIASALKATNVRVIDPAKPPSLPVKSNLPLNSAAGLLCGLMVGIFGLVLRSRVGTNIQEPGEASLLLGIPELGAIPNIKALGAKPHASRKPLSINGDRAVARPLLEASGLPALADSFRAVLAPILFGGTKGRQRVLVVTSAGQGDGKTTTTSNLAAAVANLGGKVLLIDGDIRSPRLHEIFGLENSTGLTTALKQIASSGKVGDTFVQETAIRNLNVLTSGPSIAMGADLLFSSAMPGLIAQLRDGYDMILIDTPPMLLMPDARALGRIADGVILVARSGQTARTAIQAAVRR
ncbi:MAG TPA: polysaccharide biosynthesis tyrosine autokinase, partial [Chroococcales cyanobacterium]